MKRISTIKKHLEAKGFTVLEQDGTLVLAQEEQRDTLHYRDGNLDFNYPPHVSQHDTDVIASNELYEIAGDGYMWECKYPTCFVLYED